MKTIVVFCNILCCLITVSCKKGYTCACSSADGFYDGFDIHASKKRATQKCDAYYDSKYKYVQQTDSIPASAVNCELKMGE